MIDERIVVLPTEEGSGRCVIQGQVSAYDDGCSNAVLINGLSIWSTISGYVDYENMYYMSKKKEYLIAKGEPIVYPTGEVGIIAEVYTDKAMGQKTIELALAGKIRFELSGIIKKRSGEHRENIDEVEIHGVSVVPIERKENEVNPIG